MSLISYHLHCTACGLESPQYPYMSYQLGDGHIVFPGWSTRSREFVCVESQRPSGNRPAAIRELARRLSTEELQVGVPFIGEDNQVSVCPAPKCPRCRATKIDVLYGPPVGALPEVVRCNTVCSAIDIHVAMPSDHRTFALPSTVTLEVSEGWDEDEAYRWHGMIPEAEDAQAIARELSEGLKARGHAVERLRCRRHSFTLAELRGVN